MGRFFQDSFKSHNFGPVKITWGLVHASHGLPFRASSKAHSLYNLNYLKKNEAWQTIVKPVLKHASCVSNLPFQLTIPFPRFWLTTPTGLKSSRRHQLHLNVFPLEYWIWPLLMYCTVNDCHHKASAAINYSKDDIPIKLIANSFCNKKLSHLPGFGSHRKFFFFLDPPNNSSSFTPSWRPVATFDMACPLQYDPNNSNLE